MKVLNLYAGIGGNRKLWTDCAVTAVERDPGIAKLYQEYYPDDQVIVGDAHQFLLEHYKEFNFIWTSPPCPTHSQIRVAGAKRGQYPAMYPDFKLWQEITFLKHYTKDVHWCVENVELYYDPIIKPSIILDRHSFWSNFHISSTSFDNKDLAHVDVNNSSSLYGFDVSQYEGTTEKRQIIRNLVKPDVGLHIFKHARGENGIGNQYDIFLEIKEHA